MKVFKTKGCAACNDTGYKGRTGLFEVMEITDSIREIILSKGQPREIKKIAMKNGMISLRQSGLVKIKEGVTTVEEVLRETVKDGETKNDKNNA
jgi:type IV pilus assembly protein PilB